MWQQIITSLIYFLAVGVHVTDASCDETHMIFSQNHDKGISPNCKTIKNILSLAQFIMSNEVNNNVYSCIIFQLLPLWIWP